MHCFSCTSVQMDLEKIRSSDIPREEKDQAKSATSETRSEKMSSHVGQSIESKVTEHSSEQMDTLIKGQLSNSPEDEILGGPNAEAEVKRGKITEVTLTGEKSAGVQEIVSLIERKRIKKCSESELSAKEKNLLKLHQLKDETSSNVIRRKPSRLPPQPPSNLPSTIDAGTSSNDHGQSNLHPHLQLSSSSPSSCSVTSSPSSPSTSIAPLPSSVTSQVPMSSIKDSSDLEKSAQSYHSKSYHVQPATLTTATATTNGSATVYSTVVTVGGGNITSSSSIGDQEGHFTTDRSSSHPLRYLSSVPLVSTCKRAVHLNDSFDHNQVHSQPSSVKHTATSTSTAATVTTNSSDAQPLGNLSPLRPRYAMETQVKQLYSPVILRKKSNLNNNNNITINSSNSNSNCSTGVQVQGDYVEIYKSVHTPGVSKFTTGQVRNLTSSENSSNIQCVLKSQPARVTKDCEVKLLDKVSSKIHEEPSMSTSEGQGCLRENGHSKVQRTYTYTIEEGDHTLSQHRHHHHHHQQRENIDEHPLSCASLAASAGGSVLVTSSVSTSSSSASMAGKSKLVTGGGGDIKESPVPTKRSIVMSPGPGPQSQHLGHEGHAASRGYGDWVVDDDERQNDKIGRRKEEKKYTEEYDKVDVEDNKECDSKVRDITSGTLPSSKMDMDMDTLHFLLNGKKKNDLKARTYEQSSSIQEKDADVCERLMPVASKIRKKWSTEKSDESSVERPVECRIGSKNKNTLPCTSVKLGDRRGNYLLVGDEDEYKEYLSEDEVTNTTATAEGTKRSIKSNQLTTCIGDEVQVDMRGVSSTLGKGADHQLHPHPPHGRSSNSPSSKYPICGTSLAAGATTIDSRAINDATEHLLHPKVNKNTSTRSFGRWFRWKKSSIEPKQQQQQEPGKREEKKEQNSSSQQKKCLSTDAGDALCDGKGKFDSAKTKDTSKDVQRSDKKKHVKSVTCDKVDKVKKEPLTNEEREKSELSKRRKENIVKVRPVDDEDESVTNEKVTKSKVVTLPHQMDSTDGLCPSLPSIAVAIGKNAIATHGQAAGSNNRITEQQVKQVAQVNKRTREVIDSRHSGTTDQWYEGESFHLHPHPHPHLHLNSPRHQLAKSDVASIKGKKGKDKSEKVSKLTGKGGKSGKGDKGYMKLATLDSIEREELDESSNKRQIINDGNTSGDASTINKPSSSRGPGANHPDGRGASGRRDGDNDNEYDEESQTNRTFYDLDPKMYSAKKNIAQGLIDLSLLMVNASQLKYLLMIGPPTSPSMPTTASPMVSPSSSSSSSPAWTSSLAPQLNTPEPLETIESMNHTNNPVNNPNSQLTFIDSSISSSGKSSSILSSLLSSVTSSYSQNGPAITTTISTASQDSLSSFTSTNSPPNASTDASSASFTLSNLQSAIATTILPDAKSSSSSASSSTTSSSKSILFDLFNTTKSITHSNETTIVNRSNLMTTTMATVTQNAIDADDDDSHYTSSVTQSILSNGKEIISSLVTNSLALEGTNSTSGYPKETSAVIFDDQVTTTLHPEAFAGDASHLHHHNRITRSTIDLTNWSLGIFDNLPNSVDLPFYFYWISIAMIIVSIGLQIILGILLLFNSRHLDLNTSRRAGKRAEYCNHLILFIILIITIINILIGVLIDFPLANCSSSHSTPG